MDLKGVWKAVQQVLLVKKSSCKVSWYIYTVNSDGAKKYLAY